MADELLQVRITTEQKKKLQERASKMGLSLSAYVRMTLLTAK